LVFLINGKLFTLAVKLNTAVACISFEGITTSIFSSFLQEKIKIDSIPKITNGIILLIYQNYKKLMSYGTGS
jgi:hypothetical protein